MKRRIEEWIRAHPLQAFFLITIGMGFGLLFPVFLVIPQEGTLGQVASLFLGRIGIYSPVLAGMLVARTVQPGRQTLSRRRSTVFLPVWLIAAVVHTASLNLTSQPGTPVLALLLVSLPVAVIPAYVVSSAFAGADGVREMLQTMLRPRGKIVYYLVALLTFPIVHVSGVVITNAVRGQPWLPPLTHAADLAVTVSITFLSVLFFTGGINEESGWRGFAQKRLQARCSPLAASLVLWVAMVIWHIPNDIVEYDLDGYLLVRILLYPFISLLFAWVYNRTQGSIVAPALLHASMNATNPLMEVFPMTAAGNVLLVCAGLGALASDRMWRRLPTCHPAVYAGEAHSNTPGDVPKGDR